MNPKVLLVTLALCLWLSSPSPATVRYVNLNSPEPAPPYTNWANAARTIQEAVDAAEPGDQVLVTNGLYRTGGRFYVDTTNRVAVTKPLLLSSVNGPAVTLIEGVQVPDTETNSGAIRCVYLTNGAMLTGFTLTNGGTLARFPYPGGGCGAGVLGASWAAIVSNCVLVCNLAWGGGGGVCDASLYDCTIRNNTSGEYSNIHGYYGYSGWGGGADTCFLSHCTVTGNTSGWEGGGASGCVMEDCAINDNTTTRYGGGVSRSVLLRCGLTNNMAEGCGGGVSQGSLTNCFVIANHALEGGGLYAVYPAVDCFVALNSADDYGGGAENAVLLINCVLQGNYAAGNGGGAADYCMLTNCTLVANSSPAGGAAENLAMNNCTLTNNTSDYGGAVANCKMTNCILAANRATVSGGAAFGGVLVNCLLTGNSAGNSAGGAAAGPYSPLTLINCTVANNTASVTYGGVDGGVVCNSIVYSNSPFAQPNYSAYDPVTRSGTLFTNSCTTPLPNEGSGNLTDPPLFINLPDGDFRLQTNSPCINAGRNAYVAAFKDLDGCPRIKGGVVDMGAYEFHADGIGEFTTWLLSYGLPTDGSADYVDTDGDGRNNWQEWVTGTNPTNALSVWTITVSNTPSGPAVNWPSMNGRTYVVQRGLAYVYRFVFNNISTNLVGQAGTMRYVDTGVKPPGTPFYRVEVRQ